MILSGARDTIALQPRSRAPGAAEPTGLRETPAQAYVDTNCTGVPLQIYLAAADGLTAATNAPVAVFQPGYSWDAPVVFPQLGDYCILNEASTASSSVNQNFHPTQLLGTVHVDAGIPVGGDPVDYVKAQLEAAAAAKFTDENVVKNMKAE